MTCGFGSIEPHRSPKGAAKSTLGSLGLTASLIPPLGNAEYDEPSLMLLLYVRQWVGPPAAPTLVEGGAGAAV